MDKRTLQMSSVERNDWQTHLCDGAMAQRLATDKLCRVSQNLRDNTKLQTRWEQHETEIQLHGRMVLQERWRETLHSCLVLVESESEAFRQSKNVVQAALDAKDVPANVLSNCKRLRDQRHGPELVRDEVEIQLEIEVKIIEESRKSLNDHLLNISRQLCVLEELQKQIRRDLHDKSEALQIDEKCLALTNNSPCISFKPNPARISDKEVSVNNWETFNQNNKDHIEAEIRVSMGLRQAVTTTLNKINGEMATQRWVTDFALRQHIHSFELAVNELKWQLDKTKAKLEDIEEEMKQLQTDIAAKSAPLKLVHSRLEARTDRPNMELCRDQVHEALLLEKEQLRSTISNLSSQLSRAFEKYTTLRGVISQLEGELALKEHSMTIDQSCVDVRQQLALSPTRAKTLQASRQWRVTPTPMGHHMDPIRPLSLEQASFKP